MLATFGLLTKTERIELLRALEAFSAVGVQS